MTASERPELVVSIVNWRTADLTIDCLRSIAEQIHEVPGCRVFVVDNGSADGSAQKLAEAIKRNGWHSFATLLPLADNRGFAAGNNAAIRAAFALANAHAPFTLLLNPDTVVRPHALRILLEFMRAHPEIGIAGGRSEHRDATPQVCCFRFPNAIGEFGAYLRLLRFSVLADRWMPGVPIPQAPRQIDWVSGAVMMVRAAVFTAIGLLDESYFLYYEETDFTVRARRAGWTCWHVPESRVVHLVGQSSGVTSADSRKKRVPAYWFQSRNRYFVLNHGRPYAVLTDLLVAAALLVWKVRSVVQRKDSVDPPFFLRDLVRHGAICNFGRHLQPRQIDL